MSIAFIAIGVPGAGKTTALKPLAERYGFLYVNKDDIRTELTGSATDHSRDREVWELANLRAASAAAGGRGVVLDGTYAERWKREGAITLLREAGTAVVIGVYADVPLATAKERNRVRERIVDETFIDDLARKLEVEPPSLAEGFDRLLPLSELETLDGLATPVA